MFPRASSGSARLLAGVAAVLLLGAWPSSGAGQAPTPVSPDEWIGTWEGPFVTDGPSGIMRLTIAREGAAWKIATEMGGDGVPPAGEPRDWQLIGDADFSFAQTFGEFEVVFQGKLEGKTIKGTIEAYQAGTLAGSGGFTLTKQAAPPPPPPPPSLQGAGDRAQPRLSVINSAPTSWPLPYWVTASLG